MTWTEVGIWMDTPVDWEPLIPWILLALVVVGIVALARLAGDGDWAVGFGLVGALLGMLGFIFVASFVLSSMGVPVGFVDPWWTGG